MENKVYVVVLYDKISNTKSYTYIEAQWFQIADKSLLFYRDNESTPFMVLADGVWSSCREEEYNKGSDDE